jgi:hypothetical protein
VARAADSGWLKDPAFDLTLILGVTLVACAMGGAVAAVPALFLPLLIFHTWCFGFDHVLATFTKLAGLPEDRRKNRFLIFALPPLIFGLTLLIGHHGGVGAIATGYFFFQWFHTTRQSWGIAQHYRRAAGGLGADPRWLSELTMWSVPVWGILFRCHQQPPRFLGMELLLPAVPRVIVAVVGVAAVLLTAGFVGTRWWAWRRGQLSLPHALYVSSHLLVFALAYLVVEDLLAGWLLVNVWHNVQYLAYVWMHNRARFGESVRKDAPLLSWLCQRGRAVFYFAALLLISAALFGSIYAVLGRVDLWLEGRIISISLVFALALNFHHYLVDGLIWRRARG